MKCRKKYAAKSIQLAHKLRPLQGRMARTKSSLPVLLVSLVLVACGRGGGELSREQQEYEVVQEGATGGVTSTIVAGGETPPPVMPPTGTGYDTTTAFTLPNTATLPSDQQPGNLAGTLPQDRGTYYPATPRPRPMPVTPAPQPTAPAPATPAVEPEPAPPTPVPADTQPADEPEPADDEPEAEEEREPEPAPPPGEATGTSGEAAPPGV
jgi:DNA polymerase III subunit gamma/tau